MSAESLNAPVAQTQARGPVWAMVLLMASFLIPTVIPLGPFALTPHRIVLLVLFFPFLGLLLAGRAGKVLLPDILVFLSALWVGLSIVVNEGVAAAIEPSGIYVVETFGAYIVGRVAIRSAADFRLFAWIFFLACLFLLPFAIVEGLTNRNILLELFPRSLREVNIGKRMGIFRVQNVFDHPILYGAFVSTGMGLFWFVLKPQAGFFGRVLLSSFAVVATFFSMSTGALISVFVQGLVIGWSVVAAKIKNRWKIFVGGGVVAYVLIDLVTYASPFHAIVNYIALNPASAYTRIQIFHFGMENVKDNPIFGLGFGDWRRPSWLGESVDNFWLLTTMRHGVPAFALMVGALAWMVLAVTRAPLLLPASTGARLGYLTAIFGLTIAGGTVHYWQNIFALMFFLWGAGSWMVGLDETGGDTPDVDDTPSGPIRARSGPGPQRAGTAPSSSPHTRFPTRPVRGRTADPVPREAAARTSGARSRRSP